MKLSHLITKPLKTPPKEADTVNHKLLTQAGFVDQLMAGVYTYTPLGLRVLRKIEQIVREEMNAIDGQEILMPMLHPKNIWETTGGWQNIDVLFKLKSRTEKEYALGQSEEEVVTPLVLNRNLSYRDLPVAVYQIHWKFRDELRAKSGILRGREFLMKDMYSFHSSEEDFLEFYEVVKQAYIKIYKRLGLTPKVTEASGGSFSQKISYEFMVLTEAGEDEILYCPICDYCINKEITDLKVGDVCHKCGKGKFEMGTASEVGNVFDLGQKYAKDFNLTFTDKEGLKWFATMGCYGIGVSRAMGVIVEKFNDEKGIIWPDSVAPFTVHLIGLDLDDPTVKAQADKLYGQLISHQIEVLYDDRSGLSAGEKFAEADLIGIPWRVVVSKRTGDQIEVKKRSESSTHFMKLEEFLSHIQ